METVSDIDRRISRYLRTSAQDVPDHERIGPFLARFDAASSSPYLSYAIPDDDAAPTAADIATLIAAFRTRDRVPRLEYIPSAAPNVEGVLQAAGFVVEGRYPVMTCTSVRAADAEGIELFLAETGADFAAAAEAGRLAFDGDGVEAASLADMVERGAVLALARKGGRIAGTGMATAMQEGVVEIAGIGVVGEFRCCGIGAAITAFVTTQAFLRGAKLAWLAPGHGAAERLYQRAGFSRSSEQLHISQPA